MDCKKLLGKVRAEYCAAMQSIFAWPGGKRNLLPALLARIPAHSIYVEGFSGSAKLLFAKEPSRSEVINDQNGDLMNFYRVAKHRPAELAEHLEHELVHPERFRELRDGLPSTEIERAAAFIYTAWYSFGAMGRTFAAVSLKEALSGGCRRPIQAVRDVLDRSTERLRRVRIEQRDIREILARFDSPETFFYLDPPYVKFSNVGMYKAWTAELRAEFFQTLSGLQGNFLMSFDDCDEIRELAGKHCMHVETAKTSYSLANRNGSAKAVTELFITPARHTLALAA